MTADEYQQAALRTALRRGWDPDPVRDVRLVEGVLGLSGETGEVTDLVKKHIFQGHHLSRRQLLEELGDVCWYVAILGDIEGIPMESIFQENIRKLAKRYPNGFETDRSVHREERQERSDEDDGK